MPSIRRKTFGVVFVITIFALPIQINSTGNLDRHSDTSQNEQNPIVNRSNPYFVISLPKQSSKDAIELHIIQTIIDQFTAILSSSHKEFLHRYKRANVSPPTHISNSSRLTMIENQLNIMKKQLAHLNSSVSLSIEDKSRISLLETTIGQMQITLDNLQKEHSETTQILINQFETMLLIGIVQSVKSGQFSFAAEQLQLTNNSISFYRTVVLKVYDHQVYNIDLLLRFSGFVTDLEKKIILYEALYYEIKKNGHINYQTLSKLDQSVRKGIFEVGTGTIVEKSQSLIRTLWQENRNEFVALIIAAFQHDEFWPLVKQVKDEIHKSSGLKFLGDVYKEVIEKVMDMLSIGDILAKVDQNLSMVEERIIIYEGIIDKMERNGSLYDDRVIPLARYMKQPLFKSALSNNEDWRHRYQISINKLPSSLKNIVSCPSTCIKNSHYDEYLYVPDAEYTNDGYRRVFAGLPKYKNESRRFKWDINFGLEFWITIYNLQYSKFLSYDLDDDDSNRRYAVLRSPATWYLNFDGEGIQMSDKMGEMHLFADDKKRNDNMRNIYAYSPKGKPPYPSKWDVIDCSNSFKALP